MNICYLILAHKNPSQLKHLVQTLQYSDCSFYIHIDKKSDVAAFKEEIKGLGYSNVVFIKSQKVRWGSISQTEARIRLIETALNSEEQYTHFVMLSGQTYPIKPIHDFLNLLRNHPETTCMEHYPLPYEGLVNGGMDRIESYAYTIFGRRVVYLPPHYHNTFNFKGKIQNSLLSVLHVIRKKRTFPDYVKPYYGIDWWVLTRHAASYIIDFIKKHPDYHRYHKYTKNTSEIYFPSILAGTNYTGLVENNSLHVMQWQKDDSGHPKTFTKNDFDLLKKSQAYFARKFDTEKDDTILHEIDEQLLKRSHE